MAIVYLESFDVYGTGGYGFDLLRSRAWNSNNTWTFNCDLNYFSSTINRNTEYSPSYSLCLGEENVQVPINLSSNDRESLIESGICGFALYIDGDRTTTTGPELPLVRFQQVLSSVSFYRNDDTHCLVMATWGDFDNYIFSGTTPIDNNKWYYIEFSYYNTYGASNAPENACQLYIDGKLDASSAANAKTSLYNNPFTLMTLRSIDGSDENTKVYYDDFYLMNYDGGQRDFLGEVTVRALLPNDNGDLSELIGHDGDNTNNYLNVDDEIADDGSTYNSGALNEQSDLYNFDNLGDEVAAVFGVQTTHRIKEQVNGTNVFCPINKKSGGSTQEQNLVYGLTDSFTYYMEILEQDPDTTSAWLKEDIDSYQFGIRIK